jgi:hypothetical protein
MRSHNSTGGNSAAYCMFETFTEHEPFTENYRDLAQEKGKNSTTLVF